ncbi:phospholipase A [Thiocystis violacea]|uniref:phospholipase A n=1 Tax=Thiocystis violacea TaxID=13725 RepID=UPI00190582BF|nr:phospholipase A [Thiocystis violacea]MBK1717049.1 phospholipase [Thiocystis violacea]
MINQVHREHWIQSPLIAATLLIGSSVGAHAAPSGNADCKVIEDDEARLACYDRASGVDVAAKPAPARLSLLPRPPAPEPSDPSAVAAPASLIDTAWGFDPASPRYTINLYRPNYLQFGRYTNKVNEQPSSPLIDPSEVPRQDLDPTEARFQISFKARLWATDDRRWGIWGAYTQQSQWQIYNGELSRPFRETNYMPELMVSYRPGLSLGGFNWNLLNVGLNHQSNGRSDPTSRSWNRLIAEIGIERGNFALLVRPWYRIEEDVDEDDNPDILDYYGHGDITAVYKWRGNSFTLMGRGNPQTDKGAAQFTWTTRPILGPLRGYVQAFTGYGDSLIDYNWKQSSIGIGVILNDLL